MTERTDDIGFGDLKLIQNTDAFCYGIDAVLCAWFAAEYISGRKADSIADLGCGNGIIPLILSHKTDCSMIFGVEVQDSSQQLAVRNAELNGLQDRISIIRGNVADDSFIRHEIRRIGGDRLFDGHVDAVVSNPPYQTAGCGLKSEKTEKMIARHEIEGTLDDFIRCAAGILKSRGDLFLVHRPSRLADIIETMRKHRIEPKEIQFVLPKDDCEPNIMLIHGVKDGGRELRILKSISVYEDSGEYTKNIKEIYEF